MLFQLTILTLVTVKLRQGLQDALQSKGVQILYEDIATSSSPPEPSTSPTTSTQLPSPIQAAHLGPDLESQPLQPESSSLEAQTKSNSMNSAILYIGSESLTLTNLLMTHGLSEVCSLLVYTVSWAHHRGVHRYTPTIQQPTRLA